MIFDLGQPTLDILKKIKQAKAENEAQFRDKALVLYAGCNIPCQNASSLYAPSLSAMPAMGVPDAKEQPGTQTVAALEVALAEVASKIFNATWADARLQSCTIANLAIYHAFGERGVMLSPSPLHGGHFSQVGGGTPDVVGLSTLDLPFDAKKQGLDTEATVHQIRKTRPKLVMLGRSVLLEPEDIEPVAEAASSVGAITIYDGSHVAGLIAGGVFPNPLNLGVDIMTMSTYKTLGGPPGAIVCGKHIENRDVFTSAVNSAFLANQDAARYPVLLASLLAFRDGSDEPRRVLENAIAFKNALIENGLPVLLPNRQAASHQVVVPTGSLPQTLSAMRALEAASLLVGRCPHPGMPGQFALRFGVQYVTRLGLDPEAMIEAAALICRLLRNQNNIAVLDDNHEYQSSKVQVEVCALIALNQNGWSDHQ